MRNPTRGSVARLVTVSLVAGRGAPPWPCDMAGGRRRSVPRLRPLPGSPSPQAAPGPRTSRAGLRFLLPWVGEGGWRRESRFSVPQRQPCKFGSGCLASPRAASVRTGLRPVARRLPSPPAAGSVRGLSSAVCRGNLADAGGPHPVPGPLGDPSPRVPPGPGPLEGSAIRLSSGELCPCPCVPPVPGTEVCPASPCRSPRSQEGCWFLVRSAFSWSGRTGDSQAPHVQNQKRFPLSNNSKKCF